MASRSLVLGLAGNVPFYAQDEYYTPSAFRRLKRWFIDYRCLDFNQPVGKGATQLLEAMSDYNKDLNSVHLRMWGNVSPEYHNVVSELCLNDSVEISGFFSKEESLLKLEQCDVLVLTLALGVREHPPFSLPGKMFDYFLVGKPILALVQQSYCSEVLRDSGLAMVVDPLDNRAIQNAFSHFVNHKDSLKDRYKLKDGFLERFGHKAMVNKMADLFDEVLK